MEKSLREWEQLHILRWCIADHAQGVTGGITLILWRVVEYVFCNN